MAKRKTVKRSGKGVVSSVLGKAKALIPAVINRAVDLLPFEAHVPGYNYCGPGTRLAKRLARGDKGVNALDEACKLHDIAYAKYADTERRAQADRELAERAWNRVKASDSSLAEKAVAYAVTNVMKAKAGTGRRKGRGLYLRPYPKRGQGLYLRPRPKCGRGKKKRQSRSNR